MYRIVNLGDGLWRLGKRVAFDIHRCRVWSYDVNLYGYEHMVYGTGWTACHDGLSSAVKASPREAMDDLWIQLFRRDDHEAMEAMRHMIASGVLKEASFNMEDRR